jgi:hypothetical protein
MNANTVSTKSLSSEDRAILNKLQSKAWFVFLRLYGPLFLFLLYIYARRPGPGEKLHISRGTITREQFDQVFPYLATVFGAIFLIFVIKDFRRLILPYIREARANTKYCHAFIARKYHDPIYDKYLLFYPEREDFYIQICADDFNSIGNGEDMYLEVASVTGEVLYLKSPDRVFKDPEEFSFSDM